MNEVTQLKSQLKGQNETIETLKQKAQDNNNQYDKTKEELEVILHQKENQNRLLSLYENCKYK